MIVMGPTFRSNPDPFTLTDTATGIFKDTNGKSLRSSAIDPTLKTLVLISVGESNRTTLNPSAVTPVNAAVVDNFNVYDGATYNADGALLGTQFVPVQGPGNLVIRLADLFVTNARFARVIIVPLAIGSTTAANWAALPLADRVTVAMRRLAARGITPASFGATFCIEYGLGANDNVQGTSQAAWQASFGTFKSNVLAAGFSGRIFVSLETWAAGATSAAIRAAQAAVVDNVKVFQSGDIDTLGATKRQPDNTHLNDTGAAGAATLIFNAMHASGAPF